MKKSNLFFQIVLFFAFVLGACDKDNIKVNSTSEFDEFAKEEMEYQHIPAMSVLIFKEESILYEKHYGYSSLEEKIILKNDHLFLAASISKVVTATALLQLYDKGLFDLNDAVTDYLPYDLVTPGYENKITFKMLLTHTSGIADNDPVLDGQYYYNQDPTVELSYFIQNYLVSGGDFFDSNENFHNFKPGENHEYSNIGSALIAVLVEEISGTDFNTYCKEYIFNPLGMKNTFWRLDEITQTIATPYDYLNGANVPIQHYTHTDYPNGGLRTTVNDLSKLLIAFSNGGMYNSHQLLLKSTVDEIHTPQIPSIDSEVGLHFFIMDASHCLWGHDGGEQGVASIMAYNSVSKIGVIILANQGEADLDEILSVAYKLGKKI